MVESPYLREIYMEIFSSKRTHLQLGLRWFRKQMWQKANNWVNEVRIGGNLSVGWQILNVKS